MWRRWDDRLYAWLVLFWRAMFAPRPVEPLQPAPRVLVSVGVGAASDAPSGEMLGPAPLLDEPDDPDPPDPAPAVSRWAARPSHSKAWLACVLLGELQAGVMLRAVWEVAVRT